MQSDELLQTAMRMKRNRLSSTEKSQLIEVKPVVVSDLVAMAAKIKANRIAKMEDPKPIPPQRYAHYKKAFLCRDLFGSQLSVFPTPHSIERFAQRYNYVDHYFYPKSENEVMNKMRDVFNLCKHKTDIVSIERNQTHGSGNEIISWGNNNFNFVVDTKSLTIITSELCGALGKYN
jgi:hypothetical protein